MNSRFNSIVTAILFVCLIAAICATVYIAVTPHVGERFTEFYILGPSGKAYDYPTNLTVGESGTVIIGIVNHEYEDVNYRVVITLDNETIDVIDNIRLKHEEVWEENYTFKPEKTGERMKLEFLLYREGVEEPYRTLHLWVSVHPRKEG